MRTSVLLTIVMYLRHGSIAESALSGMSSNSRPTAAGAHRCLVAPQLFDPAAPCTDSMQTSRVLLEAAAPAAPPRVAVNGIIASRYGSATVAPSPRRKVRRGIGPFVRMFMVFLWVSS